MRIHARLLLSQDIFSLEKKPTIWLVGGEEAGSGEGVVWTRRKYLKPETSKNTDLLSRKSLAKRERFWQNSCVEVVVRLCRLWVEK